MGKRGRRLLFSGTAEVPQPLQQAVQKMKSLGLPVSITKKRYCYMISANGYKVIFKHSSKPLRVNKRKYFRINNVRSSKTQFDFLLCACMTEKENKFFIIPRTSMPRTNVILLPDGKPHGTKYAQFKEAWNTLVQTSEPRKLSKQT